MLSAGLGGDVAGGDLVLVGGEGCPDLGLLAPRDLGEVQRSSKFCCDFIKFCGGNAEFPMGFFKAKRRFTGLGGRELERPTRNTTDP